MPQGFQERRDVGVRLGAEKAEQPDECLVREQLIPGTNISFDKVSQFPDIILNVQTSGGDNAEARQLFTYITPSLRPGGGTGQNFISGNGLISIESVIYDSSGGATPNTFKYGTVYYGLIAHNWNLSDPNRFMHRAEDTRFQSGAAPNHLEIYSHPKVIGIDANRLLIWITRSRTAVNAGVQVPRIPRYAFSLVEVL